jgi:hypothetical protein
VVPLGPPSLEIEIGLSKLETFMPRICLANKTLELGLAIFLFGGIHRMTVEHNGRSQDDVTFAS